MTITRLALPAFFLTWVTMAGLLVYGWLTPQGQLSSHWLGSWYPLMLGLMAMSGILILLVLRQHRRTLDILAEAMPSMVEHGVGYQIRNADACGEEAVLFNRLSRRLAATLTELDDERQLLSETLDNVDGVILVIDGQGKIDLITAYAEHAFGWHQDQLTNHPVSLLLPQYAEISANLVTHGNEHPEAGIEIQSVARCEDGQVRGVVVQFQVRTRAPGHVLLVRDVTSELEAEREAQLLKDALDSSNESIMLFDSSDQLIWANRGANSILTDGCEPLSTGQSYQNIMTRAVVMGLFPEAVSAPESWIEDAQHNHQTSGTRRSLHLKSGRWVREQTIHTRHGGSLSIFTDITADKNAEQLQDQKRKTAEADSIAKGRFLAVMSHEIRTPLNGIIGMLELLQLEKDSQQHEHYINTALDASSSLATLVNDLLDLSRLDAGKLPLNNAPCQLPSLVKSVVDLIQPLINKEPVQLRVETDPLIPEWVELDAGRIRQILLNLLGNAVKFTEQGRVQLTINIHMDKLRFEVSDTGIGMTPQQQEQLFQLYSTADTSYSRNRNGAGLGLAISRRLVDRMGGQLQVESTPGKGSCFWFELTLKAIATPTQAAAPSEHDVQSCRILLVEDNDTNRMLAQKMLLSAGHQVDVAENGSSALAAVQQTRYQLILMDISMPVMDGIEATQQIRTMTGDQADTPIIAMTAHHQPEEKQAFITAGMNDYLAKPVRRAALLAMVARWGQRDHLQPPVLIEQVEQPVTMAAMDMNQLDLNALKQMAQDVDQAAFPQLIELFVRNTRERQTLLSTALNTQDYPSLQREVHSLKSSAAAYGLVHIQSLAAEIEQLCKDHNYLQLTMPTKTLLAELEPALSQLEAVDYRSMQLLGSDSISRPAS